ncbi:MAG: putative PEP-binding protein [Acidimicrobiales bacterium]
MLGIALEGIGASPGKASGPIARSVSEIAAYDQPCVLVAADLTPAETALFDTERVAGIATERGGLQSHAAILARSLEVPAVLGVAGLLDAAQGLQYAEVDGDAGEVLLTAAQPATPPRPTKIMPQSDLHPQVSATVSSTAELDRLLTMAPLRVGLVRSELIAPDQLTAFLKKLLSEIPEAWIRLPDLGGDKSSVQDPNPALGLRGIRRYRAYPEELERFMRALGHANSALPVHLLIPMLTNRTEVEPVIETVRSYLDGRAFKIGAMIETPAAALQAQEFARLCDFLCIGTTDLAQYVYAADRQTPALNAYAHPAAPPLMELYGRTIQAANDKNISVGVCGMAASDRTVGPFLLAAGASHLSVPVNELHELSDRLSSL